jgi:hypothetical protein
MTNGVIAKLDFDGDESQDIEYQVSANKTRDQPKQWVVDSAWCLCEEAECFVVRLNNLDLSKEMLSTVRALYFVK